MRTLFFAGLLLAAACDASEPRSENAAREAPAIVVRDGWAPPTPGGVAVSAGYLTLENRGRIADTLVSVSSPRAARAELHETIVEGAVARMRPAPRLALAPGETIALAPGGRHLMFHDVTPPFVTGESVPVRLRFERAGEIDTHLTVRPGPAAHAH